jgi:hypothetical protein
MGFRSFVQVADSHNEGKVRYAGWRKVPTQATLPGVWFDLSMSPGTPIAQYYAASPLEATIMARSTDIGIDHGQNTTTTKHLRNFSVMSTSSVFTPIILMDYLMFYPFIDQSTTGQQDMDNTASITRHVTGDGVQIMAVSVAAGIGGQTFQVNYTNQDGVSGRLSQVVRLNAATYPGAIATTERATDGCMGPFIPLQQGDRGVRSIESFTMISGADIGLLSLVLVKPVANLSFTSFNGPVEVDFFLNAASAPVIENDSYLNMICCPISSIAGVTYIGDITTVWS